MNTKTLLAKALRDNHITLDEPAQDALLTYLALMKRWNKVYNLTSICAVEEQIYLHLIDSLLVSPFLSGEHILDIGTGAGLPGMPLAIMHPEKSFTLLDKNAKKTRFLTQVVAELGLKNVTIANVELSTFQPDQYFDSILSRAFGTIKLFLTLATPFLSETGQLLAMKGRYPQEELAELDNIVMVHPLVMRGMAVERHLVALKKIQM